MSAPLIWIGIPLILAFIVWFMPFRRSAAAYFAGVSCLVLFTLTRTISVGSPIFIGPFQLEVSPTLILLGRSFVIDSQDIPIIGLIYLFGSLWSISAGVLYPYRSFASIGIGVLALLVASLSVEPFLYAALLIEAAILVSVPMLTPPGQHASQGVMRYVIFQTFALPFILFAGWVARGVEANPADIILLRQAILLLGLGFAFLFAIIPFYFWIPLFCSQTHSFLMGFILSFLPIIALLLAMEFLDTYIWLRNYAMLPQALRFAGLLMVITAGIFSAFQKDLRRLFGYAVIMENGYALLALSVGGRPGIEILVLSFIPRMVSLWVWATSITVLFGNAPSTALENCKGIIQRYPFATIGLMLAYFSLSGLPLLPGFPLRAALLSNLSEVSLEACAGVLLGMLGFLLSGFRLMTVLASTESSRWTFNESWQEIIVMVGGIILLILSGIFPNWVQYGSVELLKAFSQLV